MNLNKQNNFVKSNRIYLLISKRKSIYLPFYLSKTNTAKFFHKSIIVCQIFNLKNTKQTKRRFYENYNFSDDGDFITFFRSDNT